MGIPHTFMKNKIFSALKPFRVPIIILAVFLLVIFVLAVVMPSVNSAVADTTPIIEIAATNDTVYKKGEKINIDDFDITSVHENGKEDSLGADDVKLSTTNLNPVGATTTVSISLKSDENIKCETEVSVERNKVVGFKIGYPEISDVTAVLYSNGELCFEGEGDVLVCNEGEYPWFSYDGQDENPITAVSFEEGVTPTDMNYWFEGMDTLTYVDKIPSSVMTMNRTFADCIALTQAADWTECTAILNINEVYSGCTELKTTYPIQPSTKTAYRAFGGCSKLPVAVDSSNATDLVNAQEMYAQCTNLTEAEIAPNAVNLSGIFSDCINLQDMPTIPDSAKDLSSAFQNDARLQNLTAIPADVENVSSMFSNCQLIHGELTVDCDARDYDSMFADACTATEVNLVGASKLLDVYANTNADGHVYVNGKAADKSITSYDQVFTDDTEEYTEDATEPYEETATPSRTERDLAGSGGDGVTEEENTDTQDSAEQGTVNHDNDKKG